MFSMLLSGADVRYVKIFEYVKGAHIKGDGIIEVPVDNKYRQIIYLPTGKRER